MINVLVVDDQNLTHKLIETYLKPEQEIEIVGFASNGQDAIEQINCLQPDVVLMDVEMPKLDGLSATKIITEKFSSTKVLILTVHDNERHLGKALENGAKGYLLKTTTPQELKNAIHFVNQGYFQLSVELTEKYLQKIVRIPSESNDIFDLKRKISYLYKSLNRLKEKVNNQQTENFSRDGQLIVKELLQEEMVNLQDRDSHLQFKVDRMKYNQERLEQRVKYLSRIQLSSTVAILIAIALSALAIFN